MKALVTGGGGFLGGAIVRLLLAAGHEVRSFSRGRYAELEKLGVEQHTGDLADMVAVAGAARGCEIVFHVAANAGVWGRYKDFYLPNVLGTQNVIAACKIHRISRLVYTSTPSVVSSGNGEEGIDESAPYPRRYLCHYASTKADAEQIVLASNGPELATVALRPRLIWGPGDTQLVPRILARARAGRLRLVGDGRNLVDSVFIDNAAHAHILASERLGPSAACAGKAYFITNGEPVPMGELLNMILAAGGLPPVTKQVSPTAAYAMGAVFECLYSPLRKHEPPMTRFIAQQLAGNHWYDISAARRDLGYEPHVSIAEGMARLAESLPPRNDRVGRIDGEGAVESLELQRTDTGDVP